MVENRLFKEFIAEYNLLLEVRMAEIVSQMSASSLLKDSMLYSLKAGGKRIRPLLMFLTIKAFGQDPKKGLDVAAAIEMIHTYSLIHDDLPSMDDDDLRRGKATNHKVFGEAAAILAGDALLTLSFKLIADMSGEIPATTKLELISELSKAAGAEGMVEGQSADIQGEGKELSLNELEYIHTYKTGKLLMFSVLSGAILAGADFHEKEKLGKFAHHLGLAFQIRDDILDLEGTEELIGKPVGSDTVNNKSTYPALLTMDGAKKALEDHIRLANEALLSTGLETSMLEEMTELVARRLH
ncbi:polyprenyl synthetase family protein [Mesobacillus harenae]|uniref:polyprenyl synthetase family protein n=1 Tax=Mesobacillus harenae TaxID=2213203 RepID=UPI001580B714|nr:farnesyl diphosphate synthase [Mesobacillus harenae]